MLPIRACRAPQGTPTWTWPTTPARSKEANGTRTATAMVTSHLTWGQGGLRTAWAEGLKMGLAQQGPWLGRERLWGVGDQSLAFQGQGLTVQAGWSGLLSGSWVGWDSPWDGVGRASPISASALPHLQHSTRADKMWLFQLRLYWWRNISGKSESFPIFIVKVLDMECGAMSSVLSPLTLPSLTGEF